MMADRAFRLPDLGEGLPDAEIVAWHIEPGETVVPGQPLLSVETAKAVVEIPSPCGGSVAQRHGEVGDVVNVGSILVEIVDSSSAPKDGKPALRSNHADTVVGNLKTSDDVVREQASGVSRRDQGARALPAVRALAKRLNVELAMVTPSGPDGLVTADDVKRVAKMLGELGPLEPLRGVRRSMARTMSHAHAEVVPVTVFEDADIHSWPSDEDVTVRLIRAIVAACRSEPALNAWYDSRAVGRRVLERIDLGLAVDTAEGLFVPVLRDVGTMRREDMRRGLERLKRELTERSLPAERLRGNTITLSNFGMHGGRYATPMVVPPTVAIVAAGKTREAVIPIHGQMQVRRVLPLSLTFDHRCVTGGEAARFLTALIRDLEH